MTARLRSPIIWFGGKGKMTAKIVPLLESILHKRYVEPFGGGASVLLGKRSVELETYNDIDSGLVGFFRVLADPVLFQDFYRRVVVLPYSRELYNNYRATWREEADPVLRAAKWFVVARMAFAGHFGSFGTVTKTTGPCTRWLICLKMLPEVHARLQRVQIEHADWRVVLDRYDTPETLFYCDPPYPHGTRSAGKYAHEMTDADHSELVQVLLRLQGKAVVSSYPSSLYTPLQDAGWTYSDYKTACHAAGRTRATGIQGKGAGLKMQPRTERLWKSPNATLCGFEAQLRGVL